MYSVCTKDGLIESFDEEKIKNSLRDVLRDKKPPGDLEKYISILTNKVISSLKDRFSEKRPLDTFVIKDIMLDILNKEGLSEEIRDYTSSKFDIDICRNKFLSKGTDFLKKIEEIAFIDSINADMKRENANINGNTAMGTMLQFGSNLSKDFAKSYLMSERFAKAHDNGDIHVHDLDFYAAGCTTTCCQIDLDKLFKNGFSTGHGYIREPQDIMSYAALSAIIIQANQNDQHGGQSLPLFDYNLALGVLKTFKKKLKDIIVKYIEVKCLENNLDIDINSIVTNIFNEFDVKTIKFSPEEKIEFVRVLEKNLNSYMDTIDYNGIAEYFLKKALQETDRQTYQAMEAFVHNLNTMSSRAGAQVPFSSVNFGTDTSPEGRLVSKNLLLAVDAGLGHGETSIFPILIFKVKEGVNYNPSDPNYDLFKLACKVSAKRLFPNFSFIDAPFNLQYYKEGHPETEIAYMGCRTRVISNVNGRQVVTGRGNLSFTTINLPRLGIKHGILLNKNPDIDGFFAELNEKMDLVKDQLLERYHYQCQKHVKNFPFLMGEGVWMGSENLHPNDTLESVLKHGTLTVGFIGLAECLKALIGKHHGESDEAQELGLRIIEFMRKKTDEYTKEYGLNFSLIATPAEGLSGRFTKIDKKLYGEIEGVTDRAYYTNSFHIPVYYNISAYNKIKKEAPYHALTNGGHITYIELDGDPIKNLDAFEDVVRTMKELGIGYGAINHPVDRDPVCGFTGIIDNICPGCSRKEDDVKFERIRRITGYLVGTLDRFNDAKRNEVLERVKHTI